LGDEPDLEIGAEDLSSALEALSDQALAAAMRIADQPTVLRALAASSERLLGRVLRRLPRRQARQLKRLVRSVGPTRLADLRRAQHELLRIADECRSETSTAA
jgi:flagellar motor switch protein FliG